MKTTRLTCKMESPATIPLNKDLILKLLKEASERVVSDVARELYADKRMETEGGTLSIREYCTRANIKLSFDETYSSLLDCNLLTVEFDSNFSFTVIENVCTTVYDELKQNCKEGLTFLKTLLSEVNSEKVFNSTDTTTQIEEFKKKVKVVYKGVSQAVKKDLNKNLQTIDQMADNISNNYKKLPDKPQRQLSIPSKAEKQTITPSQQTGANKLWRRNSKLTVSISQVKKPLKETDSKSHEARNSEKSGSKTPEVGGSSEGPTKPKENESIKREKKHPERVVQGCKELSEGYTRLHSFNAGSWYVSTSKGSHVSKELLPLEQIFTNVRIRNGVQEIEMKELLTHSIEGNDRDVSSPLILIQGLAGSGKTSLCYHFIFEWQKGYSEVKNLCDFDFVILIEACKVRSGRLKEFLRDELLPNTTANMECDDIIPWLKTLDILFIFDGYYEIESVSYDIIEDVLAKFNNQRIIVTTRPEVHKDFVCMARRHLMDYTSLELSGFDVPRLKDFTRKVFKIIEKNEQSRKTQCEGFLSYINGRGRVLDKHLKLPLTILLLIFLWKNEPDILNAETTATQLYEELYILYFQVLTERTSKYFRGVSQISHVLESLLIYIGEKAWEMVKAGTTTASDDTQRFIRDECEGKGIRPRELMSALHMYQIDNNPAVCKLPVTFQHNTQIYYLAATYLVDRLQRHVMGLQQIEACAGVEHVLMFIMGHLAYQNALTNAIVTEVFQIITKMEIDPTNYEFWWSMLLESRFQSQVGFHIAKEKLPQKHWHLNEVNVVRGLKLLALTPLKLWSLIIDIPDNKEPHDIPEFLEALMETGKQIKKRQKRIVKVDLHLRHHEKCSSKSSDDFLRALHPWADLQTFTGHLGSQEAGEEIFSSYFNLSILQVKVSTMDSFHSLSVSLKKIQKTVKTLRVTIALPKLSPPGLMAVLKTSGNLEISVADMEDQHRDWLVEVINKVCGRNGCWRLNLLSSRLTYDTVEWLVTQLNGRVHDKLNIETKE